ncbi:MAG: hypothetical protein OEU50_02270 [Gammaproteobacteria bacterium]|nr:hypothetical protein [Gammaproteobacteria bacterium]
MSNTAFYTTIGCKRSMIIVCLTLLTACGGNNDSDSEDISGYLLSGREGLKSKFASR